MRLANPIYDAAFKYLFEDTEIAKGLIERIIGEEITELSIKPQEIQVKSTKYLVMILRIDFKAIIKTKEGKYKKVLIEIQKGKDEDDILRFRRYLSDNYRSQDEVKLASGEIKKKNLSIIPIYFLGFRLKTIKSPVVKANRHYKDLVTNEQFTAKENFIEKLTHDGFFIQIPRLHQKDRNELERVLKVFNQSYKISSDKRLIDISEAELNKDPLLRKIGDRLLRAASNEEVLAKMNLEDEVEERIEKHLRELAAVKEFAEALANEKEAWVNQKEELTNENEQLKQQIIEAIKQLMLNTELTDNQIAVIQNVEESYVREIRGQLPK